MSGIAAGTADAKWAKHDIAETDENAVLAYAELKEGNVTASDSGVSINETFEAMAGVPSTRTL